MTEQEFRERLGQLVITLWQIEKVLQAANAKIQELEAKLKEAA
jgi:hypothetical protein